MFYEKAYFYLYFFIFIYSQSVNSVDQFQNSSALNFEHIYMPIDFPDGFDGSSSFYNGVQYINWMYSTGENTLFGATITKSNLAFEAFGQDVSEYSINSLELIYKQFQDEDSFMSFGIKIPLDNEPEVISFFADATNISNFITNAITLKSDYGLRNELNSGSAFRGIIGLEYIIPTKGESDNQVHLKSVIGADIYFNELVLSMNYRILMNVSEEVDDFSDRFLNTFSPEISYLGETTKITIGYHIYTSEFLTDLENRISLGLSFYW